LGVDKYQHLYDRAELGLQIAPADQPAEAAARRSSRRASAELRAGLVRSSRIEDLLAYRRISRMYFLLEIHLFGMKKLALEAEIFQLLDAPVVQEMRNESVQMYTGL